MAYSDGNKSHNPKGKQMKHIESARAVIHIIDALTQGQISVKSAVDFVKNHDHPITKEDEMTMTARGLVI